MVSNTVETQIIINSDPHASNAENFYKFLNSINPSDILVYSDGSKAIDRILGIGFVIFQLGRRIHSGSRPLGKNIEVYDAEVLAALYGLRDAITLPTTRFANNLWVLFDNKEVARKHQSKISVRSSKLAHDEIIKLGKIW